MTEQFPSAIGTVAQEAARLIEDMATMARSSYSRADDPSPYAGAPAQEDVSAHPPGKEHPAGEHPAGGYEPQGRGEGDSATKDEPSGEACSLCGAERQHIPDDTPAACKLCPLCRGIALLRSVRPETVDLLADLALSVATSLREVAMRSRASDPTRPARSSAGSSSDGPPGPDRAPVQDIPVDDETEG